MPSLLRSEAMSLVQLYIPNESAHPTVAELGEMKRIQLKDLNPDVNPFQRTYVSEIRRLDEMSRRLTFFTSLLEAESIPALSLAQSSAVHLLAPTAGSNYSAALDELDTKLTEHESRLSTMNGSYDTLRRRLGEMEEARHVLRETAVFFERANEQGEAVAAGGRLSVDDDRVALLDHAMEQGRGGLGGDDGASQPFELEFVAGTIDRTRMPTFERVLWRVLRGNLYLNWAEIDEPLMSASAALPPSASQADQDKAKAVRKVVFIIFAHGEELLNKIRKIADSMGANVVPVDPNHSAREQALREVTSRMEDLTSVLYNTNQTRRQELADIARSIAGWWAVVRKEKRIFGALNLCQYDQGKRTLIAEGWVPTSDIGPIQDALRRATENAGTSVPAILHELRTHKKPPTFHRTNKFTEGFQAIVDAYGIASYQEVNPALFAVITFPFLFAVMFGDIGHGLIMFLAALTLVLREKKLAKVKDEIFGMFYSGRYMVLLMGAFAIFTGFMYNDIFSLSLTLAPSAWKFDEEAKGTVVGELQSNRYPFGLDPSWHGADNGLVFTNSLKMKMSIILGVIHMSFAICLQVPNHIFFGRKSSIWAEFLPQILFMECIFGYLVLTVLYKWAVDWSQPGAGQPPNLLNMLIYMFLSPGSVDPSEQLYAGQPFIQVVLILVAVICIPWMLCAKPYLEYREHQKIVGQGYGALNGHGTSGEARRSSEVDEEEAGHVVSHDEDEEHGFDMGDIIIHQSIHTIEFALGCISNTASYLRLWALSLAHAQLSEVLWTMTLENAFGMEGVMGVVFTVVMFAMWFTLSVAILIVMEGLSAFLHALRLHWVESNGKHYEGAGYAFEPLSFEGIDEGYD